MQKFVKANKLELLGERLKLGCAIPVVGTNEFEKSLDLLSNLEELNIVFVPGLATFKFELIALDGSKILEQFGSPFKRIFELDESVADDINLEGLEDNGFDIESPRDSQFEFTELAVIKGLYPEELVVISVIETVLLTFDDSWVIVSTSNLE